MASLILVQSVFVYGDDNWTSISKVLKQHPYLQGFSPDFFAAKNCSLQFSRLVNQIAMDPAFSGTSLAPVEFLANKLHHERMNEIKASLHEDQSRILKIMDEIKAIEEGKMDHAFKVVTKNPDVDSVSTDKGTADDIMQIPRPNHLRASHSVRSSQDMMDVDDVILGQKVSTKDILSNESKSPKKKEVTVDTASQFARTIRTKLEEPTPSAISTPMLPSRMGLREKFMARSRLVSNETSVPTCTETPADSETDSNQAYSSITQKEKKTVEELKIWKRNAMMLWNKIADHRYAAIFMNPVKEDAAPGYYSMIRKPMSLLNIKNRIRDGEIETSLEFHRDICHLTANAIMYNGLRSEISHMATEFQEYAEEQLRNIFFHDLILLRKSFHINSYHVERE